MSMATEMSCRRLSEWVFCIIMGTQRNGYSKRETFILSVDVGTTSIRCHVYDKNASIRGSCSAKVNKQTAAWQVCANHAFLCVYKLLTAACLLHRCPFCILSLGLLRSTLMNCGKGSSLWSKEQFKVRHLYSAFKWETLVHTKLQFTLYLLSLKVFWPFSFFLLLKSEDNVLKMLKNVNYWHP